MFQKKVVSIRGWDELVDFYRDLDRESRQSNVTWIFRGQKNTAGFKSSLERAAEYFDLDWATVPKFEEGIIRKFQRQFHQYGLTLPDQDNRMEWLAWMQHYGAPTRLLDWTYSLFVAAYFAIEFTETECALWALNVDWWAPKAQAVFPEDAKTRLKEDTFLKRPETFNAVFKAVPPIPLVYVVNPFRLNERLVIQQGCFLCPGDTTKPFEDNLAALQTSSDAENNLIMLRIDSPVDVKKELLRNLHRMNMNRATLFPGLDGFAQALRTHMVFEEIYVPVR